MGKSCYILSFVLFFMFKVMLINNIYSVGAYPYPQNIGQTDGTHLTIQLHGDEWFNWISTVDEYRIIRNDDGLFEYAIVSETGEVNLSGIRASNPNERDEVELAFLDGIEPGSRVSREVIMQIRERFAKPELKSASLASAFPNAGEQKLLVILANFNDTEVLYGQSQFNDFMNQPGYNGTGSFRDYYLESSGGRLNVVSVVTQWVQLPKSHDYYGPKEKWGEFAYDAVVAASNAGIDFSQFDNTGDGLVEGVAIIHQGPGQEITGDPNDIWSHSWSLRSAGYTVGQRRFNGVLVDRYTAQPETRNTAGDMNTIGVISHEFGHNLGLPDYYDTSGSGFVGTGRWDIMASGTYNGSPAGSSPAHHNPYSKIELGWANEIVINEGGRLNLEPVIGSEVVYRVNSPVDHEYLLLENRQKAGFDAYLRGKGMMVFHVDENKISEERPTNSINTQIHQGLYPIAAGGTINAASAPYPGSLIITELTDETNPSTTTWTGEPFNRSLTGIHQNVNDIVFDFMAIQNGSPLILNVTTVSPFELSVAWEPSINNDPVLLAWSQTGDFGQPENGVIYQPGDLIPGGGTVLWMGSTATTYQHSGLESSTVYYYSAWSDLNGEWSMPVTANGTTDANYVSVFPWVESFENGLGQWRQIYINGSYQWELVQEGIHQKPQKAFDGDYFSLFFVDSYTTQKTKIVSPLLELSAENQYGFSFRHIQNEWDGDQDHLEILVKKEEEGSEWEQLAYYNAHEPEWVQRKLAIPYSVPLRIAFVGVGQYGYGVGLDNIVVSAQSDCSQITGGVSNVAMIESSLDAIRFSWTTVIESNNVLILARKSNKVIDLPESGVQYNASVEFGMGDLIGDDTYVVYSGNGSELNVVNLMHSSEYYFAFFTYDNNYCYQFEPDQFSYSTEKAIITKTIKTVNETGVALEGAAIHIGDEVYYTDANGEVIISIEYFDEYIPVSISFEGYYNKWVRFVAVEDDTEVYALTKIDPIVVSGIEHENDYKTINLKWNPVIDEMFDGTSAFSLTLPGWSMIDNDGSATYALSGLNFPNQGYVGSYIVLDPFYSGLLQADFDMTPYIGRHLLAAFSAVNGSNDDWLISPSFVVNDDAFSFYARSLTDTYGLESFQVLIKVEDGDFELLSNGTINAPVEWTNYEFSLSSYANSRVQLAIRYVSDDALALLLDNIRVTEFSESASGAPMKTESINTYSSVKRSKVFINKEISLMNYLSDGYSLKSLEYNSIGYEISLNGQIVGSTSGFFYNAFEVLVDDCKSNEFLVRSEYRSYNKYSSWSDAYFADACYSITFIINDAKNIAIKDAIVKFNHETLLTREDGVAYFTGVDHMFDVPYEVSKDSYTTNSGLADVNANVELFVLLEEDSATRYLYNLEDDLRIYYSPQMRKIYIEGDNVADIEKISIYDLSGKLLWDVAIKQKGKSEIDVASLKRGVYVVKIESMTGKVLFVDKLIVL